MVHERRKGMQYLSYLYIKLFTRLLWCAYMFYSTRCYTYTRIVAGWSAGYSLRTLWSVWEDSWPVWWTFRTAALEDNTHGERECVWERERERERERRERERERAERERERFRFTFRAFVYYVYIPSSLGSTMVVYTSWSVGVKNETYPIGWWLCTSWSWG